jgi:peptide/nickel transport system substrate-binding protein
MHFVVVPDSVTLMAALKNGEVDAAGVDLSDASVMEKDSKFVVRKEGMNLLGLVLTYNAKSTDSVWSDIRMREALEYALNKESITDNLLYGYALPLYEIIRGVSSTGDSGTTPRKYDLEKAKQLIADTGNEGLVIELRYSSTTAGPMKDALLAVQENINDVGLVCEMTPIDFAAFNLESFQPNEGNSIRCEVIRGDTVFPFTRVIENLSETTIYLPGAVRPDGFTELQNQAMVPRIQRSAKTDP